jgi:MoaA/NifB/PqqE/SkfB family radical SAM enzyme
MEHTFQMRLLPPQFLFLTINQSCNLRCQHCHYWQRQEEPGRLSTERLVELVREMAELNPQGRLVICGGEPLLDLPRYYAVCRAARAAGLRIYSVSNGTRITEETEAQRLLCEGPHEVSISLDDWRPDRHDTLRGQHGAFLAATSAVRRLARARDKHCQEARVNILGLVHRDNYKTLPGFYRFALGLGANKLKLNLLQPTFGPCTSQERDACFAELGGMDGGKLMAILYVCNALFELDLNPAFIAVARDYCETISGRGREAGWSMAVRTKGQHCNSFERNIMVDASGRARLCFAEVFPFRQLQNQGDLRTFWQDAYWRPAMAECRRLCAISHSVRREPSTLAARSTRRC